MSNTSDKQQQLITKLKEIFQLDQPELDFGLYKIMHAKAEQISQFIETDLIAHIDEVFGEASTEDSDAQLQKAKEEVIAALGETAFDTEGKLSEQFQQLPAAKPYLDALQASKNDGGTLSNSASIYDHLYRFFSRYYDSGDFLSRRHHVAENAKRAAPYAVPYDGREVYLHWANKDQYYIKTSESFNSYTFNLTEAIAKQQGDGELSFGSTDESRKIHFQLVDADEGEHNNVKENQARFFIIHIDEPVKFNEQNELVLQFEYRADPNKKGQNNTWQENKLKEAEALIFETLDAETAYKDWSADLKTLAPTEKNKSRTLLAKYLKQYTARNTMDYFIHKDLGGFLSRELDFYIKNEIMHLDDIEQSDAITVESWLLKVRVLRQVAKKVISFLAQLEEFQKKLWLKKKFVTETNYCMTLDRVPETFYKEILACEGQLQEWEDLGFTTKGTEYTEAFLKENPFLVIDTGLFDASFKERLLAEIEDLDETTDGVLIHSENFQALNLMQERYREQVKCIYIDPPYNTNASEILYKNSYKNSSWLSLMHDRLILGKSLLRKDAVHCLTIDDIEIDKIKNVLDVVFGEDNYLATTPIRNNPQGRSTVNGFSVNHEYAIYHRSSEYLKSVGRLPRNDKQNSRYNFIDSKGNRFLWENFRKTGTDSNRLDRPKQFYPIYVADNGYRIPKMTWDEKSRIWTNIDPVSPDEVVILPLNDLGIEKVWKWGADRVSQNPEQIKIEKDNKSGVIKVFRKNYLNNNGKLPGTWWDDSRYGAGSHGTNLLTGLFGKGHMFSFPKSLFATHDALQVCGFDERKSVTLDYFGGSGTTAHAVIQKVRQDNIKRLYAVVEAGEYFEDITRPRVKKVIFSENWKNGKPEADNEGNYNGISHCFKYNRLESYEDTINNLITTNQVDPKNLPDEYILNYLLEAETAESPSLINIEQFKDPMNYRLTVKKPGSDEQAEQAIDLIETFNWLIGLRVEELDKWRSYNAEFSREKDSELPDDQHTRLFATKLKEYDAYSDKAGEYQLRLIEGWCCRTAGDTSNTDKVLVVWRKITDDLEKDAAILEAVLNKKGVNQADSEYDLIYINGSHGLQLSGQSKSRLMSLEETFMAKMWEDAV